MSKIALLLLLVTLGYGQWDKTQDVRLQKDEPYRVIFHEQVAQEGTVIQREFVLRWTLFVNDSLTVTVKYDGFNHHHVMKKKRGWNSVRLQLLPRADSQRETPYMLIEFQEFDDANNEAYFGLYIKDHDRTNMQIQ